MKTRSHHSFAVTIETVSSSCPRVVIDTNILISALVFGGQISRLRFGWQSGSFTPLVSKVTTTELIRVLAYPKFQLSPTEIIRR